MEIIIIAVLFTALAVAGFIIRNLLRKVEIYEDDILFKDDYITRITTYIEESDEILKDPKVRSGFESDDEIGVYFKKMNDIQLILSGYAINYDQEKSAAKAVK